ncbi:alpha/beta hydrolase [Empedobacter falsenii]
MKKLKKNLISSFVFIFLMMNIIAIFHAYKFTHFIEVDQSFKRKSPNDLTTFEKVKMIFLGVENPKPSSNLAVPKEYKVERLKSNVELEIWIKNVENEKGIVLLFHGYSSEKTSLLENANYFNKLGYSTILTDFMGSGNSEGYQTTIGFFEAENVKTVYNFALKNHKNVILYGNSMGVSAIMRAVAKKDVNPSSIIIECPFGTMKKTVDNRFKNMNIPTFPMSNLLTFWGGTINNFWAFDHNPEDYAKSIKQPILLLYGEKDKNVTNQETQQIFQNIQSNSKILKTFPQAGHENYLNRFGQEWKQTISSFLDKVK